MKSRYTKRVREEAALICAIAASGGVRVDDRWMSFDYDRIGWHVDSGTASVRLALKAWKLVCDIHWTRNVDAEAEALIRTGWTP